MASDQDKFKERKRRARNALIKRLILGAALIALGATLVWAFMPKPLPVEHAPTRVGKLRITIEEEGQTRVRDSARYVVSAPLASTYARSALSEGDAVEVGQVVARLSPLAPPLLDARTRAEAEARVARALEAERHAKASVARLEAASTFAERELKRLRQLEASGATDERSVERAEREAVALRDDIVGARLAVNVAAHELAMARAVLGSGTREPGRAVLEVPSPLAGTVLKVFQHSEAVVQPGTPLVELGDSRALEIVAPLLTTDAVKLSEGAPATIMHWGGGAELAAHIRRIEPSATTRLSALGVEEQRVDVLLSIDSPRELWRALGDGYRVELSILVSEGEEQVLAPASALIRDGAGHAVFRIEDGRARLTRVKVGRRNPEDVELLDGLPRGARVIVHPSDRVLDGIRVASVEAKR